MKRIGFLRALCAALFFAIWAFAQSPLTDVLAQQATPSPTALTSPTGIYITVSTDEPFANVRTGPSSSIYPTIGRLFPGESAPALGRSPGGDWIQILFADGPDGKAWIYSPLVRVTGGTLEIVEPPPTPVPPPTSTIDPTLAAEFTVFPTATRLPTFTPAPTFAPPTDQPPSNPSTADSIPLAVMIVSFGGLGVMTLMGSFLFRRK